MTCVIFLWQFIHTFTCGLPRTRHSSTSSLALTGPIQPSALSHVGQQKVLNNSMLQNIQKRMHMCKIQVWSK